MRNPRAVTLTALAAVSAMVITACGNTDQAGTTTPATSAPSSAEAPASSDAGAPSSDSAPASGSESASGSDTAAPGTETSGSGTETPGAGGACGIPHGPYEAPAKVGGSVKVSWNQPAYSWNPNTSHANAVANVNPRYLANTGLFYYNDKLELVNNDSFGTCEKLSDDPLTMKYTLKAEAKWQDGTPVTAADLLLQWASGSGQFNTEILKANEETGEPEKQAGIAFDSSSPAMSLVTEFPEISEDGQSLTIKYSEFFVDYPFQLDVGMPAHVVAMKAGLGGDAKSATDALVKALKDFHGKKKMVKDADGNDLVDPKSVEAEAPAVKKIVDFWNTGFDWTELPSDPALYLGNGPYKLVEYKKDAYMTFKADPNFTAGPKPSLDQITYRIIPEAMGMMQALQNQEVDIANPQATADVLGAANKLKSRGYEVINGDGATYEHVDLAVNNGGPFDPKTYGGDAEKAKKVRQAFLKVVPRQEIVDKLIKPLNPNAQLRDSFNVVPGSPAYDSTVAANGSADWKSVDIEGAKKLLAEAGATNPTVRLMYAEGNVRRANEFKMIQETATKAGFKMVDGANKDWGRQLSNTKIYDAALFGWQSSAVGVSQIPPNFKTGGQNNFYGYSNKEVDELLKQLNVEPDRAKQDEINTKVEKILFDDAFGVPIFQFPEIITFNSKKIQGVKALSLSPGLFWNHWEWTVP